jgi:hypothetical protein
MIFTLQKGTVRIIAGVKSSNSCGNLFMRSEILPLPCESTFTLMSFVVNNHRPTASLSSFQKRSYCAGIKIFNSLPSNLRSLMTKKIQFKVALKRYLNTHFFYYVEEFLTFEKDP